MPNRKAAEASILADIEEILPGSDNPKYYQALFDGMDDEQFDGFMQRLISGQMTLSIIAPNFADARLEVTRNFALARKWGHSYLERIWMDDGDGTPIYLTNDPYPVMEEDLGSRRCQECGRLDGSANGSLQGLEDQLPGTAAAGRSRARRFDPRTHQVARGRYEGL
jgi:hypothetical protein